jgi:deoxyribodipyrimidine photo-lyase
MRDGRVRIVWYGRDLRVADHVALAKAGRDGAAVVPVFIYDEQEWGLGGASKWWLHRALKSLEQELRERGMRLVVRKGKAGVTLRKLVRETGAEAVYAHRRWGWGHGETVEETGVKGVPLWWFNGSLLYEPGEVLTKEGRPYQVFTPFYKACLKKGEEGEHSHEGMRTCDGGASGDCVAPAKRGKGVAGDSIDGLGLEPVCDWDGGLEEMWEVSEAAGAARLREFVAAGGAGAYGEKRDLPGEAGTSRLSPYLAWGLVSVGQVMEAARGVAGAEPFVRQLYWREFAYHLLWHFPKTVSEPLRDQFADFPWADENDEAVQRKVRAWQRGQTGYPMVDAGMRELWATGWMHNRVRMIAGSFLVKDLRVDWRVGARWFWDTLVDADWANNTLGWQWVAGCGADAAPYFRVFNPTTQGRKFDPDGVYVKRWVKELREVDGAAVHDPPALVREAVGYAQPIVDHAAARRAALAAYEKVKGRGK